MTFTPKFQPAVRVVVIEDDENDRALLLRQLRKSKIDEHVKFLTDGKEALIFLSDLPPAQPFCNLIAIFLDLKLPSISGLDLLRQIKQIQGMQNVPIIIVTSSLDPKDFEECQRQNVAAFVPKPVTFESFSKAITGLTHLPS
jgi:two-component system, response regulator